MENPKVENHMDRFRTPEDFIRAEVLANRGTQNIISKRELYEMVAFHPGAPMDDYTKMSKEELLDKLVEWDGAEAYKQFPCGVSSRCFQIKFGIGHKDVLKMAKAGFISVTGEYRFRKFGKYLYANTYSPYDYFGLTAEEVQNWLKEHSRKKKEGYHESV